MNLNKLQVVAQTCGNDEIIDFLTSESVISDVRRAYGRYIFNPNDVITHRFVLSYRIKKILEKNGVLWSGDPLEVNVTRTLVQICEHVARETSGSKCG